MNANEILRVLDSLAKYIVYVYPGYITIYIYRFLRAKCVDENKEILIKSIAISFYTNWSWTRRCPKRKLYIISG